MIVRSSICHLQLAAALASLYLSVVATPASARSLPASPLKTVAVRCSILAVCPQAAHEGGGVAIHVRSIVETAAFLSLDLLPMRKDGVETIPVHAPDVTGLGGVDAPNAEEVIFFWKTATGDAGVWEICFESRDDSGGADTCCDSMSVRMPDADHVAWNSEHIQFADGGGPFDRVLTVTTTHSYDSTYGVILPFLLITASGYAFLDSPLSYADIAFSPEYNAAFESQSMNLYGADGSSADTLLMGLIDFGGPALGPGSYDITVDARIRDSEGVIQIDTVGAFLDNQLIYHVTGGAVVAPTFAQGCFAVTVGRCTISMTGDVNQSGTLTAADIIAFVNRLFRADVPFVPCDAVGDVNCDGDLTAVDILRLVNYMFKSGTPPCDVCRLIWDEAWACP